MSDMKISRGDIVLMNFAPRVGREIKKIRPALVLQNDIACKFSPLLTVIPFTSAEFKGRIFEMRVPKDTRNKLLKDSVLLTNQIMSFDKKRLAGRLGKINPQLLERVFEKIDLHFGRD